MTRILTSPKKSLPLQVQERKQGTSRRGSSLPTPGSVSMISFFGFPAMAPPRLRKSTAEIPAIEQTAWSWFENSTRDPLFVLSRKSSRLPPDLERPRSPAIFVPIWHQEKDKILCPSFFPYMKRGGLIWIPSV